MADGHDKLAATPDSGKGEIARNEWPEIVRRVRARTPARLLAGRAGAAYRTETQLDLRAAHAAARDAVRIELDMREHFSADFVSQFDLFEVSSAAASKEEYLLRPDLGRQFNAESRSRILLDCGKGPGLQIVLGDGLSVTAVAAQAPSLLKLLSKESNSRRWSVGQAFVIRHCRVGILNEIGELLNPSVAILLIGERPGLATAESLSAYMAYRPEKHHTDANRNLISNIHPRGVSTQDAADRILNFAARMMHKHTSGVHLPEELSSPSPSPETGNSFAPLSSPK